MAPGTPTKATEPRSKKPPDKDSKTKVCKRSQRVAGILSDMIEIRVGNRQKPFQVHKNIISSSSPFFRKACNGPWKESQLGRIELAGDDPESFEVYIMWLYFDTVEISIAASHVNYSALFHAYRFGDKILDYAFKNSIIDHIIKTGITTHVWPGCYSHIIYEDLPASSCLRQLHLDIWAWAASPGWLQPGKMNGAPTEFFIEMARKQMEVADRRYRLKEKSPWITDPCQYHEHPEGTPKCSEKSNE